MSTSQYIFAAEQYATRAREYVASAVHSSGADLDQIEAELHGQSTSRVLDLGCGGGHVSYRAAPHVAEVVACDVTASMLDAVAATAAERGLSNIIVREAPAENLPFPDASFDVVLCRFTTHHWQNMEAGLRQARRVLKPAGRAIFIDTVAAADPVLDTHLQAGRAASGSVPRAQLQHSRMGLRPRSLSLRRRRDYSAKAADGVCRVDGPHTYVSRACGRDQVLAGRGTRDRPPLLRDRGRRQL
jgi:SAM-dependent methyltransferase